MDGDTSTAAVIVNTGRSVIITNNTVEGGSQGLKIQNSTNAFIYNNTIQSNSNYGIYLLLGSNSAEIKYNKVKENEDTGIYLLSSNSAVVKGNTIEDNNGYGITAQTSTPVSYTHLTLPTTPYV